jgi:copper homeostasis protein (lipoprotein)
MFIYMADAPSLRECQSGQRWPVSMEAAYKALETAYLNAHRPAEELLVSVEGQVTMRPHADGGHPVPTLIVERFLGIWPGETCGDPFAVTPLENTLWKLTRLGDQPVVVGAGQREPDLVFRSKEALATGFSGCNQFTGGYKLNGGEISFGAIAGTRMACPAGMEIEDAFLKALGQVRSWEILGQHLELYDSAGNMLARFEARASK